METKQLKERISELETTNRELEKKVDYLNHKAGLLDRVNDLVYRYELSPERKFTYVSPSATEITGYSPEDHYRDPDLGIKLVHPGDRQLLEKATTDKTQKKGKLILRWVKKNGEIIWTEHSLKYQTDEKGMVTAIDGIARDITEKKHFEENLLIQKELNESIIDSSPAGIAFLDLDFRLVKFNKKYSEYISEYTPFKPEQALGKTYFEYVPGSREVLEQDFEAVKAHGKEKHLNNFRLEIHHEKNRLVTYWDTTIVPVKNNDGIVSGLLIQTQDVTEKNQVLNELNLSREMFSKAFHRGPAIMTISAIEDGKYLEVNDSFLNATGFKHHEVIGKTSVEIGFISKKERHRLIASLRNNERVSDLNLELKKKDGSGFFCKYFGEIITIDDKQRLLSIAIDATEQRKAENELQQSEYKFRHIFESAGEAIIVVDKKTKVVDVNPAFTEITGIPKEELIGQTGFYLARKFAKKEYLPKLIDVLKGLINNKPVNKIEIEFRNKILEISTSVRKQNKYSIGIIRDVTEQRIIENELRESEKKFREIYNSTSEAIVIHDTEKGAVYDCNNRAVEMYGYGSKQEMLKSSIRDFSAKRGGFDQDHISEILLKVSNKGSQTFEWLALKKNGEEFWVEVSLSLTNIGGKGRILAVVRDISDRKKTEDALKQSEEKFRKLFEFSPLGISIFNIQGKLLNINDAVGKMTGYSRDELMTIGIEGISEKEDIEKDIRFLNKLIKGEINHYSFEKAYIHKNGGKIWGNLSVSRVDDKQGNMLFGIGMLSDTTERKRFELALRESEQKYKRLIERMPDIAYIFVPEKGATYWSERVRDILKISPDELNESPYKWNNLIHQDDKEKVMNIISNIKEGDSFDINYRIYDTAGSLHWFRDRGYSFRGLEGEIIIEGLATDITNEKESEKALRESEKKYRNLIQTSSEGFWLIGPDRITQDVNEALCQMIGYSRDELIGKSPLKFFDKENQQILIREMSQITKTIHRTYEININRKDGKQLTVLSNATTLYDESGKVKGAFSLVKDITEIKEKERALKESTANLNAVIESTPDAIWSVDRNFRILTVNSYFKNDFKKYFGVELKKGIRITDHVSTDEKEKWIKRYKKVLKGEFVKEFEEYQLATGTCYFEIRLYPIKHGADVTGVSVISTDITDRKKTEQKLIESELFANAVANTTPASLYIYDLNKKKNVWANDIHKRLFGYLNKNTGNLEFKDIVKLVHPDDFSQLGEKLNEAIQNPEFNLFETEIRLQIEKQMIWMKLTLSVFKKDKNGKAVQILGAMFDIDKEKKSEEAIKLSEQRLREAEEIGKIGHVEWDVEKNQAFWSDEIYKIYERNPDLGTPDYDEIMNLHQPEDASRLKQAVEKALHEGTAYEVDLISNLSSGNIKHLHIIGKPVTDGHGNITYIRGTVQDITERKKAEENLRQSETKFRTVFDQSPIGIEIYRADGMQIDANKASLDMFGIPDVSEIRNFNLFDGTSLDEAKREKLKQGSPIIYQSEFDFDHVKKLGQYYTGKSGTAVFDYIITPMVGSGRELTGYLALVQDITERKRIENELIQAKEKAEESEHKVRSMFENTLTGILFCDPKGNILEANPAVLKIMGSPSLKVSMEVNLIEYEPLQKIGFSQNIKKCLKTKKVVSDEVEYITRYGRHTFIKYFLIPIFIKGKPIGVWANINDLTDLWRAQIDLKNAKERAEESDRLKSAFLANMSHEIRTPMNGIMGFADLLKDPELSGEQQKKYINIIEKSGERMLNTINDLIDISKIESGQMTTTYSATQINEQIEDIEAFFKRDAESKGLEMRCVKGLPDKEAVIDTDKEKLYAILANLVKNAIKYTDKGKITCGYHVLDEGKKIEFFVKDTGIGIPESRQKAVFDRFVQADLNISSPFEGSGLGLAISKAYVEMLGGSIWLKSIVGKGTTFFFTIPAKRTKSGKTAGKPAKSVTDDHVTFSSISALVVEDDEYAKVYLGTILKDKFAEIYYAKTGTQAIELAKSHSDIRLILMDIKMPDMDGYEATQRIREFDRDVVVIAQTAYALAGDREKAIAAGCNDYIAKPIKKKVLFAVLKKYV